MMSPICHKIVTFKKVTFYLYLFRSPYTKEKFNILLKKNILIVALCVSTDITIDRAFILSFLPN